MATPFKLSVLTPEATVADSVVAAHWRPVPLFASPKADGSS